MIRLSMIAAGFVLIGFSTLVLSPAQAASASEVAPDPGAKTAQKSIPDSEKLLREHLQYLDGVLRARLPHAETSHLRVAATSPDADQLLADLHELEVRVTAMNGVESDHLLRKIRALMRLAGNVKLAATGARPVSGQWPGRLSDSGSRVLVADQEAKDCRQALSVSSGTYVGRAAEPGEGQSDTWLRYTAVADGILTVDTFGSDYDTQLSVFSACPDSVEDALAANDDAMGLQSALSVRISVGDVRLIRLSAYRDASGQFAITLGFGIGAISGVVTLAADGSTIPDFEVDIWDSNGFYIGDATTDTEGEYLLGGLDGGTYFATTDNHIGLLDELYENIPCPRGGSSCGPTTGSPILVNSGFVTSGIDFDLGPGGSIAGRVTNSATGLAITYIRVDIWDQTRSRVGSALTDAAGRFKVSALLTGPYFATAKSSDYLNELYNNLPCLACDPTTGAPIAVVRDLTTSHIDFTLGRLGSISGTITEFGSGNPVLFGQVRVWAASGDYLASDYVDDLGNYTVAGLTAGNYFVTTIFSTHLDELYDDLPCPGYNTCDPSAGMAVAVSLNSTTGGIDFELHRLGAISGTLTDVTTGDPISSEYAVSFRNADGYHVGGSRTDPSGRYQIEGLPEGTYFAKTNTFFYFDELYDDLPCPDEVGCNRTSGTPISVSLNSTTVGIDFALQRLGVISGTLTDAASGDPIESADVSVWNAARDYVRSSSTNSSGFYQIQRLPPAMYFATTNTKLFLDELYDDLPCSGIGLGECDPTTGTPIAVELSSTTAGVDFALQRLGTISGTLTDAASGDPIISEYVIFWDAAGDRLQSRTNSSGFYQIEGLPTGMYFASTNTDIFFDQLYDDLPCPDSGFGDCDPTAGTPIAVALNSTTAGIDFALQRLGSISGMLTEVATGNPIPYRYVEIWDPTGSYIGSSHTDPSGLYQVDRLQPGIYFATTNTPLHQDELYDDLPCLGGGSAGCDPTTGMPITVMLNATTAGIDFALDYLTEISGRVTNASGGAPLVGLAIDFWDSAGAHIATTSTYLDGRYGLPLPEGSYFVSTDSGPYIEDEIYDNIPCLAGSAFAGFCDPMLGTPVSLVNGTLNSGIDFELTSEVTVSVASS